VSETILVGRDGQLVSIPRQTWEQHLAAVPQGQEARLRFMTATHHLVRNFVVKMLPSFGRPIPPAFIAQHLGLPLTQVQAILAELDAGLFFLVRDDHGAVSWAFPVTVDPTPHRLTFSTGEKLYAA
jgi:hypothetical protein